MATLHFFRRFLSISFFATKPFCTATRFYTKDTIFALSSGPPRSGIAVIRVSGSSVRTAMESISGVTPEPKMLTLRPLHCPNSGELLDKGMVVYFPSPNSFTGEDVGEFHVHGSLAVIESVLTALSRIPNCRASEAGEFSRRAFENGKMDLTEIEGLSDLLEAETDEQRRQALRQMNGTMRKKFEFWREQAVQCLSYSEAIIDFADDEDDVDDGLLVDVTSRAANLIESMENHLKDGYRGEIIRDGFRVAIIGPPNAGKSSLLNCLTRREVAIVSPHAGTTRDVLEVTLNLQGYCVILSDTAGIRDVDDVVEKEGIRRAKETAESAQIKLMLVDAKDIQINQFNLNQDWIDEKTIVVLNKVDLINDKNELKKQIALIMEKKRPLSVIWTSCITSTGLNELIESLTNVIKERMSNQIPPLITRHRHRFHLNQCIQALKNFLELEKQWQQDKSTNSILDMGLDGAVEELRSAINELGKITGRVDVEELLDSIFRDFCIGK